MRVETIMSVETVFRGLPRVEREAIIAYGAAIRLTSLKKRQFLAESKMRHFQEKYGTSLTQLEMEGLPDDAGFEMHEDYVMWHHWQRVLSRAQHDIAQLEMIANHGLQIVDLDDVSG